MKLLILLRHIGHYHHARLEAVQRLGDVTVLVYGDTTGVIYDEYRGEYSYSCILCPGNSRSGMVRKLYEIKPDVLVLPGWSERRSLTGLDWALKNDIPTVVFSDSQEKAATKSKLKEWVKSRIVRLFSAALVAGRNHVEYITKLGMPVNRVFIGYDAVDNEYFISNSGEIRNKESSMREQYGLPDKYFLSSNRFIPRKNLFRLIEAYRGYLSQIEDGWKLVLLGDGELMPEVQQHIKKLGLESMVILPGFKQYADLPVYYGLADCYIQASTSETWGLVVNEAMASGLPVLVSKMCGCCEDLVAEGGNGFSFDPFDIDEITEKMVNVSSGCDLQQMGQRSREIISNWTPEVFAENLWKAVKAAIELPCSKKTILDQALLWWLSRK